MKQITVAVCIDDENGRMFGGRRQSRDRVLIADLLREAADRSVYIGEYSRPLFGNDVQVTVCKDPIADCADGGVCFAEEQPLKPHLGSIGVLILYRWNRLYPADVYLDIDPMRDGFSLISSSEFTGSSHEKITKEVYGK
ncbi:MAG: ribonuclease Z [Clostridia bacterium]|nr:ribonuclease Z [Clostridia bacterium]